MNTGTPIETVILTFLKEQVFRNTENELDPQDNLLTSGLIDSMGVMRLIAHLEKTYTIKVPPADFTADNFQSVAVIAAYVMRLHDS